MSNDRWIGATMLAFAIAVVFVWVPLDTDSGLVEIVRRRAKIGDALAPTVAGVLLAFGAVLTLLRPGDAQLNKENLRWLATLLAVFAASLAVMRFAGPIVAEMQGQEYRTLRDTAPWKYIGFVCGGTLLITALGLLSTGRNPLRFVAIGLVASIVIALVYDVPFDDLLLPPNGDV